MTRKRASFYGKEPKTLEPSYEPLCNVIPISGTFKRGVTERGVFVFACQYMVSLRDRTGSRTVTQMRHPLLVEGRPNCARQSLASTLSALRVAATSYFWCAGTTPILEKNAPRMHGANENLSGGVAAIPGIAPRVAPRIVGFVLIKS